MPTVKGALFGPAGVPKEECLYRFVLWRTWDKDKPTQMWIMLNPSTADEVQNDPTVERVERRARDTGFGGVVVCNLFAFRSTDPNELYECPGAGVDPIGPVNDDMILQYAQRAGEVVCAWGTNGAFMNRGHQVTKLLRDAGIEPKALKLSAGGHPVHPLYQSYRLVPQPMKELEEFLAAGLEVSVLSQ